jgi:hypothetical protein
MTLTCLIVASGLSRESSNAGDAVKHCVGRQTRILPQMFGAAGLFGEEKREGLSTLP